MRPRLHCPLNGSYEDISGNNNHLRLFKNSTQNFFTNSGSKLVMSYYKDDSVEEGLVCSRKPIFIDNMLVRDCTLSIIFDLKIRDIPNLQDNRTIIKCGETNKGHQFQISLEFKVNRYEIVFKVYNEDISNYEILTSNAVSLNEWHNHCYVLNKGNFKYILDEQIISEVQITSNLKFRSFDDNYFSVGNSGSFKEPMYSDMSNLLLFDTAITSKEIHEINICKLYDLDITHSTNIPKNIIDGLGIPPILGGGGTTPPTIITLPQCTPFGKHATVIRKPANNENGYAGCRATGVSFNIKKDIPYSALVYLCGNMNWCQIYVTGGNGMMDPFKHMPEYDIGPWMCWMYENASIPKDAGNYFTFYARSKTTAVEEIIVAYCSMEEGTTATIPHGLIDNSMGYIKNKSLYRGYIATDNLPLWRTDKDGNYLKFNGDKNKPNHIPLELLKNTTLEQDMTIIIKFRASIAKPPLFQRLFTIRSSSTNHCEFNIAFSDSANEVSVNISNVVGDRRQVIAREKLNFLEINTIVVRKNKTDIEMYANNEFIGSISIVDFMSHVPRDICYVASSGYNAGDMQYDGSIYDFKLYSSYLSLEEINSITDGSIIVRKNNDIISNKNLLDCRGMTEFISNQRYFRPDSKNELETIDEHTILLRSHENDDAWTEQMPLKEPILPNEKVFIEFTTVYSEGDDQSKDPIVAARDKSIDLFFFYKLYTGGDKAPRVAVFHKKEDGPIKKHKLEFTNTEGVPFKFYRFDLNYYNHSYLIKDFNISKVKTNQLSIRETSSVKDTNLISYRDWRPNSVITDTKYFTPLTNGDTNQHQIGVKNNPFGFPDIMFINRYNDDGIGYDGGFHSMVRDIDPTFKYRLSLWVKRENYNDLSGEIYFGSNYKQSVNDSLIELGNPNQPDTDNPYLFIEKLKNFNDDWVLLVGYIYPHSTVGYTAVENNDGGVYSINGYRLKKFVRLYKFKPVGRKLQLRAYLYYSKKHDEVVNFYRPRIDKCDGTEPTIEQLLMNDDHKSLITHLEHNIPILPDDQFIDIKYEHGVKWGKIFYHNNDSGKYLFSEIRADFMKCHNEFQKSILYALPNMADKDGEFEFLLEYDSFEGYLRWSQGSIFIDTVNVYNYKCIHNSWSDYPYFNGMRINNAVENSTYITGSNKDPYWFFAIGAKRVYNGGIPGPGFSSGVIDERVETKGVHLWVKINERTKITPREIICNNYNKIIENKNNKPRFTSFIDIKYEHGVKWGKIFYHNNDSGKYLFSEDEEEFLFCNTPNKKSILYALESFRNKDGKFEFLLEYENLTYGYNRWKQTSLMTKEPISGYEPISVTWTEKAWCGLEPCTHSLGHTYVDGSSGSDFWYSIGQKTLYNGGIPGPGDIVITQGVSLWVKID